MAIKQDPTTTACENDSKKKKTSAADATDGNINGAGSIGVGIGGGSQMMNQHENAKIDAESGEQRATAGSNTATATNNDAATTQHPMYSINDALSLLEHCNVDQLTAEGEEQLLEKFLERLAFLKVPQMRSEEFLIGVERINNYLRLYRNMDQNRTSILNRVLLMIVYEFSVSENQFKPPAKMLSSGLAVVLGAFDDSEIAEICTNLADSVIDEMPFRAVFKTLFYWLPFCYFCDNLETWIVTLLASLNERKQNNLLVTIALDNLTDLLKLCTVPVLRKKLQRPVTRLVEMTSADNKVADLVARNLLRIFGTFKPLVHQGCTSAKQDLRQMINMANCVLNTTVYKEKLLELIQNFYAVCKYYEHSICDYKSDDDLPFFPPTTGHSRVGLINLGNTCYLNSTLQALANTNEFCIALLQRKSMSRIVQLLQKQFALMCFSMRTHLLPKLAFDAIQPPGFSLNKQQDSSEYLAYLLDTLHEHELAEHRSQAEKKNTNEASTTAASQVKTTTVEEVFDGRMITTIKCMECGFESRKLDSFRDIPLSFDEEATDEYYIEHMFDTYFSVEKVDGDNQYLCDGCKEKVDAERCMQVTSAPNILILSIKHFKYDVERGLRTKLSHRVNYSANLKLKLHTPVAPHDSTHLVHYSLFAGIVHHGVNLDSGHYYACALGTNNVWQMFNDKEISACKPEDLNNMLYPQTPYILLYRKCAQSNVVVAEQGNDVAMETDAGAELQFTQIPPPMPLKLQDLPFGLQHYVNSDNHSYWAEQKLAESNDGMPTIRRDNGYGGGGDDCRRNGKSNNKRNGGDDDDDDARPPPTGGCGDSNLFNNANNYIC